MKNFLPYKAFLFALVGIIIWLGIAPEQPGGTVHRGAAQSGTMIYLPTIRRSATYRTVNALQIPSAGDFNKAAIFWFGRVSQTENYADVRIGYSPTTLFVRLTAFDRRIWYNDSTGTPVLNTLTEWDGASFFYNTQGKTANLPLADSYRFTIQWSENNLANHVRVSKGNGQNWVDITAPFTLRNGWRGNLPNDDSGDDSGWSIEMEIPFTSLGGAPSTGAIWGMAVDMYDRDNQGGPANAVKAWPAGLNDIGQLRFGLPAYAAPPYTAPQTVTLRHGQNGYTIKDKHVGGSTICGAGLNRWTEWGNKTWVSEQNIVQFNVQNQDDVSDFPCFSKEYLTFPLTAIPRGKVIVSAKVVIHLFGNSGQGTGWDIQHSYIQLLRVAEDWDPASITWNNAPPLLENYGYTRVEPVTSFPPNPGIRYEFDASRAVAQAYAEGQPLRVAFYSADWDRHSGKYFYSSYKTYNANGLPAVEITYGNP